MSAFHTRPAGVAATASDGRTRVVERRAPVLEPRPTKASGAEHTAVREARRCIARAQKLIRHIYIDRSQVGDRNTVEPELGAAEALLRSLPIESDGARRLRHVIQQLRNDLIRMGGMGLRTRLQSSETT